MRDSMFRGNFGKLEYPFWGRAVYLDDQTSNTEISGNVFVGSSHAGIFVHAGSNNSIRNNVFRRIHSDPHVLSKVAKSGTVPMGGNAFSRNVFYTEAFAGEGALVVMGGNSKPL